MPKKPLRSRAQKLMTMAAAGLAIGSTGIAINSYVSSERSRNAIAVQEQAEQKASEEAGLKATEEEILATPSYNKDAIELYKRFAPAYFERDGGEAIRFLVKTVSPASGKLDYFAFLKLVHQHASDPKSELKRVQTELLRETKPARLEQLEHLRQALSLIHEPRLENVKAMAIVREINKSKHAPKILAELDRLSGEVRTIRRQQ